MYSMLCLFNESFLLSENHIHICVMMIWVWILMQLVFHILKEQFVELVFHLELSKINSFEFVKLCISIVASIINISRFVIDRIKSCF